MMRRVLSETGRIGAALYEANGSTRSPSCENERKRPDRFVSELRGVKSMECPHGL